MADFLEIKGAREHNLKNVENLDSEHQDLKYPHMKLSRYLT